MSGSVVVTEKWESIRNISLNEPDTAFKPIGADDDGAGNMTEIAHFVSARLTGGTTSATAPTTPTDGQLWIDTSAQATTGDKVKRYDDATSSWIEVYEISGKKMVDSDETNPLNAGNYIKVEMVCDVPQRWGNRMG